MNANTEQYFKDLVAGKRERVRDRLLWVVLRLAAVAYAQVLRARALAYKLGLLPSYRMPVPVISVGNITLGGTGKTPMVAWLAEYFIRRGKRVAVISRGYRGSAEGRVVIVSDGKTIRVSPEESGDEPYLLARKIPGLMVIIGADRRAAAQTAIKELQPDLFILDDAFQHLRMKRDLNILLLDATRPLRNGATLPAGFLREASSAAARADLVVYTRAKEGDPTPDAVPGKPSCRTRHKLGGLIPLSGGESKALDSVPSTARVMAFSGIADPSSFFDGLEAAGMRLITTLAFPDHTPYGEEELAAILRLRDASRSTVLLTTEKDAVKLLAAADKLVNCFAVSLELEFFDCAPMEAALEKILAGNKGASA